MNIALLLHGWGGKSNENWFTWLQKELNRKYLDVYTPNLPNTNNPILEEQLDYLTVYSSDFNEGGYIISHSLGGQLAMKFIEENQIKNSIIIMVAPSYPGLTSDLGEKVFGDNYKYLENYFNTKLDFDYINTLNNNYYILLSDNDPFINQEKAKKYYKQLKKVEFIEFQNMGHFNSQDGVFRLDEILNYIK
nr:alpha/beta hydrolase [Candidatus Gracilibacteria bacterium]